MFSLRPLRPETAGRTDEVKSLRTLRLIRNDKIKTKLL